MRQMAGSMLSTLLMLPAPLALKVLSASHLGDQA